MEIYALSGISGTGKSTSALTFAYKNNIPAIIDDGLLIFKGKKAAGISAKYEKNTITAVKRAMFYFDGHAEEVKNTIKRLRINKLLIIGTSIKMVNKITSRLELGPIDHYVGIEDIRTPSEIKMALYVRKTEGKHVIPVPHIQIEQSFFKKLITRGIKIFSSKEEVIGETTIVHPDFQKGSVHISTRVLKNIVKYQSQSVSEVTECHQVNVYMSGLPAVEVFVSLIYPMNRKLTEICEDIQQCINEGFQRDLQLELHAVHIHVTKLKQTEIKNGH